MVDDGSTLGDFVSGDNIYSGRYTTNVASGTNVKINFRFSSYGYAGSNNARWSQYGRTQSNNGSDDISINTTASPQDIYFYVNVNSGRVKAMLDSPLHVELITFTANTAENSVQLNWVTATEVNNYGFEVQRQFQESSNKNPEWEKIGFVDGTGNSNSPQYYIFEDNAFEKIGKYSYRLKQIDIDGTFEYSDIIEVSVGIATQLNLSQNYPNPFNPTTEINF